MKSGIYSITNKVNYKIYIGLATDIYDRWKTHKQHLKYNKHENQHLQLAFNKYGENAFKFERIEVCTIDKLIEREDYWCKLLNTHNRNQGYNILGTGGKGKIKHAEESKKKMSESQKGRVASEESRKRMSESRKGKKQPIGVIESLRNRIHSKETKLKRVESRKLTDGHKHSEKTKDKIRQKAIGRKASNQTKEKMKNKIITEEARNNMRIAQSGRIHSEETRLKMKESGKIAWLKRKKIL